MGACASKPAAVPAARSAVPVKQVQVTPKSTAASTSAKRPAGTTTDGNASSPSTTSSENDATTEAPPQQVKEEEDKAQASAKEHADDADKEGDEVPETLEPTGAPIRKIESQNTMLIQSAYNESQVVELVLDGKEEKQVEMPLDITDIEAMEAAAIDIKQVIDEKGTITASESAEIIQQKMRTLKLLWTHFPGAMSSGAVLKGYQKVVEKRGYTPENTLFAQSICPDEVNHEEGDITDLFSTYLGEVFHMGGLAGIPFTGKVGFGAFSHHVPDGDGHCAILMAPHIGMDDNGKFGRYLREGQDHSGSCCGAAVGAYVHCRACKPVPDLSVSPELYQFNYIINQVNKGMDRIVGETECEKQASLAMLMHEIGSGMLKNCVNLDFGSDKSTLVILTGIQINMPRPFCDFFLPLEFFIMKKDGSKEDVFEEAFGRKN